MNKKRFVSLLVMANLMLASGLPAQVANFVTKKGDKLMDGDKELRFISFNIPNLHYVEDYLPFEGTDPFRLPDEFEIRDALTSIKQFGGKVTRMYVLSVRKQDAAGVVFHVLGPGKFNEEAFRTLDKVMQIANETGVRVIIPFMDNWKWWGGPAEYAAFRNKKADEFWTDAQLREDFKKTVNFLVNRVNTYTGVAYKDDKALFCWETGNELHATAEWQSDIAKYIKSLDKNHLVMEGTHNPDLTEAALNDPNLDIMSTHHYGDPKASFQRIVNNQKMAKGKKPYLIGEFGIVPTQDIRSIMDTIINQGLSGGMIWSLRPRTREGGFYGHFEYNNVEAYHWPGFASGEFYDEKVILSLMREKAYQIDGLSVPKLPIPPAPVMLDIKNVSEISWQGSAGAQSYIIERNEANTPDWQIIAPNADDSRYYHRPLFSDETAQFGKSYSYRIKAKNESGSSDYSNVVGPVTVTAKKMVDEMENFDKVYEKDGEFKLLTAEDIRKAKEDRSRLTGKTGSYLIYKVPEAGTGLKVDFFDTAEGNEIKILASGSNEAAGEYQELTVKKEKFAFEKNEYGFFTALRYSADTLPKGTKFIKIVINDKVQISRIELSYKPAEIN
ncbi:MAG: cellulase family glycosylhydrolase [Syntrophothermus sp.]